MSLRLQRDDRGVIAPLFALALVLILLMVAFAVDLGATAERRRASQNMADSAALAAANELGVRAAPFASTAERSVALDEAVKAAKAYVANNGGISVGDPAWNSCVDDDHLAVPASVTLECISFSSDLTQARVRVPDEEVSFTFAKVAGIDSQNVSAVAVAEIYTSLGGSTKPLLLSVGTAGLNCVEDGSTDCPGHSLGAGTFGTMDSPRYRQTVSANDQTVAAVNFAVGLDHRLTTLPHPDGPYCDSDGNNPPGCPGEPNKTSSTWDLANYVMPITGNALAPVTEGLLGSDSNGQFDAGGNTVKALLYRPDGAASTELNPAGAPSLPHESYEGWSGFNGRHLSEYLLSDKAAEVGCASAPSGVRLSDPRFDTCTDGLDQYMSPHWNDNVPIFDASIVESPRFGVAPVTDDSTITGTDAARIVDFYGIYIHELSGNKNAIKGMSAFVFPIRMIERESGSTGPGLPYVGGPFGVRLIR